MNVISDNKSALIISKLAKKADIVVVVVSSILAAKRIANDLSFYSEKKVLIFPEDEAEFFKYEAKSRSEDAKRLEVLKALAEESPCVVLAPVSSLNSLVPDVSVFKSRDLKLSLGEIMDRDSFIQALAKMGYERSSLCESFGQFSVRGSLIDIFGPGMDNPVRIECFDDIVDSIRTYDIFSQRSLVSLETVSFSLTKIDDDEIKKGKLLDYILDDMLLIQSESDLNDYTIKPSPVFAGHMDMLSSSLKDYIKRGYSVKVVVSTNEKELNLKDYFQREGLDSKIELLRGNLISGAILVEEKEIYISENDIFISSKKVRHKKNTNALPIKAFTDIKIGDYIVHDMHGIGKFTGVVKLTADGSTKDYLKIAYAGEDVLYVPVDKMGSIQKYMSSEAVPPRISKLSGSDWQSIKERAKASIKDMAAEFIEAAAKRSMTPGFAYEKDSEWQKEFEDAFPYTETEDQLRCVDEIKKDMESPKAMDRLLCGDVGYGKTEVAARAIFKALEQGKQVAVLVPTTILASQHYHSFLERFKGYPFAVDMLSRFKDDRQIKETINKLEKGDIDLIVGTHRLLSKDVKFKDLGLLVIDEEQRFGVEHKEEIKRLKENVDVLTLSATPIPRTLHLSLIGVRDMSVINQPPEDRYPVQTYVMEEEDNIIKEAITRELARGGQVYVVSNRVSTIQRVAKRIKELVPEASVGIGHGQMDEGRLEDIMLDFTRGDIQILVATTIIESGLDIPNVNTLIVLDADHFGLSQLYQLRGRVGRSNRMAYAFLFYKKDKQLSEVAEKRLRAIKEFTEFGSGFRIAMRDLELRGAGNILGVEQSGHMLSIGYEMYTRLIDEAVRELKAEPQDRENIKLNTDSEVELSVSAFIPESYIYDEVTRLEMYKRISGIENEDDKSDVIDELLDRFGDIPKETLNLINIAYIRNLASQCGILKVLKQGERIVFSFEKQSMFVPEKIAKLMDEYSLRLNIYAGENPRLSLNYKNKDIFLECINFLSILLK